MAHLEKEGDKHCKRAKQDITISLTNWSKDYASAASAYSQAFDCYKQAQLHQKCLHTLNELVRCNEKMKDDWAVARNYEAMVEIYLKHYPETPVQKLKDIVTKGFVKFRMAESTDKGLALVGSLASHLIKQGNHDEGMNLLLEAYNVSLEEEKSFKRKDIFNQIVSIYIDNGLYPHAEKFYWEEIKRTNGADCEQMALIILVLILIQGEATRADKEMYELGNIVPNFLTSNECETADELIKAYKKGDEPKFKKMTTKAAITCIYPMSIIKKLREVKIFNAAKIDNDNKDEVIKDLLF